jgi:hypothetical protein
MRRQLLATALALAAVSAACGGTPAAPPPVITSFTADPSAARPNGTVTLSWVVTGATTLSIDQGIGDVSKVTSTTKTVSAPTTFTLTASNADNPAGVTKSVSVTIAYPTAAITSFTAAPGQVAPGGAVTLTWSVANAESVLLDGQAVTGTSKVVHPTVSTSYTLSVAGHSGTTAPPAQTVLARVAAAPSISAFSATPSTITQGGTATLSWTAGAEAMGFSLDNGVGPVGLRTSAIVQPTQTTTYTLTATGASGTSSTRTAIVTVNPASGTRALAYTDPATVPADAVLKLVQDASSTSTKLVLKLVTTQATSASALAFGLALDGSKVALDANVAGDTSPGFVVNTAALDPGSPAAAKASLRTDGPLANVLTLGIARKPAGGGAKPGDVTLAAGTEVARLRLVIAANAGPGAVFPLAVDPGHPVTADAYKPYKALLRAGTAQSATLPASKVALGTLTLN